MKFTVTMQCDNEAFEGPDKRIAETAMLLRTVANKIAQGIRKGAVVDSNGNAVGTFQFFEDRIDVI